MNLQEYKRIDISKDEILPLAERMRKAGNYLVMIHALINKEGQTDISWDYAVDPTVESYHVVGETVVPSIGEIYAEAATWPERELNELFGITFEGLDVSKRLFLPEDMLETQGKGQIMVTPLKELVEKNLGAAKSPEGEVKA
ncbi:MAG: NADH-quinone oxidoreductase subunit C [Oscillospiraceae bacterium]|nr:NADH-quinone oxidoreductase subunit C [Oscillospiraceae bacterium]